HQSRLPSYRLGARSVDGGTRSARCSHASLLLGPSDPGSHDAYLRCRDLQHLALLVFHHRHGSRHDRSDPRLPGGCMSRVTEDSDRIFWVLIAPVVWALHFLITYITAAFWCAKIQPAEGPLGLARALVAI